MFEQFGTVFSFLLVCPSTHADQVNIEQQEGAQTEISMLVVDKA